jgi:hypothetical protein
VRKARAIILAAPRDPAAGPEGDSVATSKSTSAAAAGGATDAPVPLGSILFTLVEPHRGHERAYNRWYERDHFYAGCMIGPWLFAGRRFVATRALKNLRFPQQSPVAVPLDAGSYLAIYWIERGHHTDHFEWANKQVHWLYQNGRGFAERTHVHTVLFEYLGSFYRDADPVPIELALDHPYAGLATVFLDRAPGVSAEQLANWLARAVPETLRGSPLSCAARFRPIQREGDPNQRAPMDLGSPTGGPERELQLWFAQADPRECWDRITRYADQVKASGLASVALAAPFLPTVPGTEKYLDELW